MVVFIVVVIAVLIGDYGREACTTSCSSSNGGCRGGIGGSCVFICGIPLVK